MKKILTLACALSISVLSYAQVKTPAASASAEYEVTVGLTKMELEYSRPNKNGRAIFGNLVPYGKIWRTGANKNSTIEFSDDINFGGQNVKAGKYAIYTKPNKDSWEVYLYSDNENWGTPEKWDDKKVVAKATGNVQNMPFSFETFSISIDDLSMNSAKLNFLWDNVYVEVPITVPTEQKVMASIDNTLKTNPTAQDYMSAANYYFSSGKDIQQAKKWFDEGMKINKDPKFYQLRQQSLIYAKAGDKKGAIELAKKSLEGAEKAKNEDYIKMNKESLKEWGAK